MTALKAEPGPKKVVRRKQSAGGRVEAPAGGTMFGTVPAASDPLLDEEEESAMEHRARVRKVFAARQRQEMDRRDEEPKGRPNPLLRLPDERRAKLFFWLRECPYPDAVRQMLAEQELPGVTNAELNEFFEAEARLHWERRLHRAATEADALIRLVEQNPVKFSNGILAALGQEAFRQIASGDVAPEAMARMTNLFLKARGDERAEQLMDLRREDARRKWRDQTEAALEAFAAGIEKNPEAGAAFEALKAELLREEGR